MAIAVLFALGHAGVRLNLSPSLPVGLYVTTSDPTAPLIEFCPDEPGASIAIARGYRSAGDCPDGGTPLLKPLVAGPRDKVELSGVGLAVNGRLVPNTRPLDTDTQGRPMPHWPFGAFPVAPGTVWVASSYNPRSFDSRYLGPIRTTAIRNRLRPLWTE